MAASCNLVAIIQTLCVTYRALVSKLGQYSNSRGVFSAWTSNAQAHEAVWLISYVSLAKALFEKERMKKRKSGIFEQLVSRPNLHVRALFVNC